MSNFQLLGCHVALAGDARHVVPKCEDDPVTLPEMMVLKHIHGPDAVTDIYEIGEVERDQADERKRLIEKYGDKPLIEIFGGLSARLPMREDFPTAADVRAAREASEKALKRRKAARDSKPPPAEIRPAPVDPEGEGAANED